MGWKHEMQEKGVQLATRQNLDKTEKDNKPLVTWLLYIDLFVIVIVHSHAVEIRALWNVTYRSGNVFCLISAIPLLSIPFCLFILCSVPGAAPENVKGHNTSSTSIGVTWGEVPADKQHGNIVNYTVIYKESNGGAETEKLVDSPTRETNLTNLKKYTAYSIQVLAATVKGDGPRSNPITVWTGEDGKYKEKNIKSFVQS